MGLTHVFVSLLVITNRLVNLMISAKLTFRNRLTPKRKLFFLLDAAMVRQPVLDGCMFCRNQDSDAGQGCRLLGSSSVQHADFLRCCRVSWPSASDWYPVVLSSWN